ncbi:hypothetical protein V7S43_017477 [Phytophthora oleae]|uniref:Uncharacterized protein n=1 Tax=Phytophthora oleae TaxID=2107226 RepID=A0ABD3ET39_9STRA
MCNKAHAMGCVLGCTRDQDVISATQKTHKLDSPHRQSHPRTSRKKLTPQKKAVDKKKKKKQHQFDGPRKGRKESFTKYIPGYVPTVQVEDPELFGVFYAAEYVDPYTGAREELQHPRKPAISPEPVPTKSSINGTPNRTCTQTRPSPTQPYQGRSCTSSSQTTTITATTCACTRVSTTITDKAIEIVLETTTATTQTRASMLERDMMLEPTTTYEANTGSGCD